MSEAALSARYARSLPRILRRLETLWSYARSGRQAAKALRLLRVRTHGLVSSSITYGRIPIHALALELEALLEAPRPLERSEEVRAALDRLRELVARTIADQRHHPRPEPTEDGLRLADLRPRGHVLIVKEDEDMVAWLRGHLEREGLECTVIREGRKALTEAQALQPDLVLLSLYLPDVSGAAVCSALRRKLETTPVFALTHKRSKEPAMRAFKAGADDVIAIPIDPDILCAKVRAKVGRRQQALSPASLDLKPGFILERRFRVLEMIGHGGMGEVYRVLDSETRAERALKILRHHLGSSSSARGRFDNEVEALKRLKHPGIIELHDAGLFRGRPYFTMEYMPAGSLHRRLESCGALAPDEALRHLVSLAESLAAAHKRRLIHRDIKSDNVLYRDGQPVITDFGLALGLDDDAGARLTHDGYIVGTPGFIAPEMLSRPGVCDERGDLYSLGIVLFEMLTGAFPFECETEGEILEKTIAGELPSLADFFPGLLPPGLEQLYRRLTALQPKDRLRDARGVARAARALLRTALATPSK